MSSYNVANYNGNNDTTITKNQRMTPYRRKPYRKSKSGYSQYDIQRMARSEVSKALRRNTEKKFFDTFNLTVPQIITSSGVIVNCNPTTQGVGQTQYVGNKIQLNGLYFDYIIQQDTSDPGTWPYGVRVIVFQYHDFDAPTASTVLQLTGSTGAIQSPYRKDLGNQFTILEDRRIELQPLVNDNNGVQSGRILVNLKNINRKYKYSREASVGSAGGWQGGIYVLLISNGAAGGSFEGPVSTWYSRLTYTDS